MYNDDVLCLVKITFVRLSTIKIVEKNNRLTRHDKRKISFRLG